MIVRGGFHYDNKKKKWRKVKLKMHHCFGKIQRFCNCFKFGGKRGENIQLWNWSFELDCNNAVNQSSKQRKDRSPKRKLDGWIWSNCQMVYWRKGTSESFCQMSPHHSEWQSIISSYTLWFLSLLNVAIEMLLFEYI